MPYIGKQPTVGNFQVCDAISVVNGQAAYTMQVGGSNVEPENANHMLVSLNGVLQKPGSSFTISGSTITFASNLATGDVIDFIILLGDVLNIGAPSDDTVSLAKLTATGTKDSTTFLRGDNTFATVQGAYESQLLHLADEKSQGTAGGSISTGSWTKTDLNTIKTNEITSASVSSSVISLPAGTYHALGFRIAYQTSKTRIRLRDTTNSADKILSLSVFNKDGSQISHPNPFGGRFTLSDTANLELQMYVSANNSGGTNALGDAFNISGFVERYCDLYIWKVS